MTLEIDNYIFNSIKNMSQNSREDEVIMAKLEKAEALWKNLKAEEKIKLLEDAGWELIEE